MSTNRRQVAAPRVAGVRPLYTVIKTLAVLDRLGASEESMRLADVVHAMSGNRGSVYQKLLTLCEAG